MAVHPLYEPVAALLRETGRDVLLRHFRNLADDQIREKTPGDPVTIADAESEARLSAALSRLTPDSSIVGEEAVAADPAILDRIMDASCWIIDPLDGTANFASGNPPFGILLALVEHGETVAGWIHDPIADRLCHAHRGRGAFIGGEPVRARETGASPPIAGISLVHWREEVRRERESLIARRFQTVDIPRCAAEQYPRLVLGVNDISLFERTLPWDHAAGALFLEEAGGKVARFDGSPYRPADRRTGMLAAASPRLWDEAAELLV